jgi:hypothetical protein
MRALLVLIFTGLLALFIFSLTGCGLPGAPLAPSLHIPKPVQDLRATRKGNDVLLAWTAPTQSTDGTLVRKPGKMVILRAIGQDGEFVSIAEETLRPALNDEQPQRITVTDSLASVLQSATRQLKNQVDFVTYRVVTVGERNRSAGPGNSVQVSALPVMNPPAKVVLRLVPAGVEISIAAEALAPLPSQPGVEFAYRVSRRLDVANAEPTVVAQLPANTNPLTVVDPKIDWENTYDYWVTPITHWQAGGKSGDVEGEDSPRAKILAHDVFPPAVPTGLQAVYAGDPQKPAIDLTWTPNSDEDLAGYNVYRCEGAGEFVKINSGLVKTPAFHDGQVRAGGTFIYAVAAVDLRGNESEKSKETSERVPLE